MTPRAALVAALLACTTLGCGRPPVTPGEASALAPLRTSSTTRLVTSAGLSWLVMARPSEILAREEWRSAVVRVLPGEGFTALETLLGVDAARADELVVAGYAHATLVVVRTKLDARVAEAKFRERATSPVLRVAQRPDLVRLSARVGSETRTLVLAGDDTFALAVGDDVPARALEAYAVGRLAGVPSADDLAPLASVLASRRTAPLVALAPGPFGGAVALGARGLLRGATAAGASLRPFDAATATLEVGVVGDFSSDPVRAARALEGAYEDLARSTLGSLLGLGQSVQGPSVQRSPDGPTLEVRVDVERVSRGLAAAVRSQWRDIVRLSSSPARADAPASP